jgi:hypothetical protein
MPPLLPTPDFHAESHAHSEGFHCVAGVDEAGRGPLAGPVVAAAVILGPADIPPGWPTRKTLGVARRAALAAEIRARARWAMGMASVDEIDRLNILRASLLAMERALAALDPVPDLALIDGNQLPKPTCLARRVRWCGATRAACPSPRPRSWPRSRAMRSWPIWRCAPRSMAGSERRLSRAGASGRTQPLGSDPTSPAQLCPRAQDVV